MRTALVLLLGVTIGWSITSVAYSRVEGINPAVLSRFGAHLYLAGCLDHGAYDKCLAKATVVENDLYNLLE